MRKMLNEEIKNEERRLLALGFENTYNESYEKSCGKYIITIYFEKIEEINEFTPYCFESNKYYIFENDNIEEPIFETYNIKEIEKYL